MDIAVILMVHIDVLVTLDGMETIAIKMLMNAVRIQRYVITVSALTIKVVIPVIVLVDGEVHIVHQISTNAVVINSTVTIMAYVKTLMVPMNAFVIMDGTEHIANMISTSVKFTIFVTTETVQTPMGITPVTVTQVGKDGIVLMILMNVRVSLSFVTMELAIIP